MATIVSRDMSRSEFEVVCAGFEEYAAHQGVELQASERYGTVAMDGEQFVGAASGLAYKHGDSYSGWFQLTDLFVKEKYRRSGIGSRLLQSLEADLKPLGVWRIWTWTAGYEAPKFYVKHGYRTFAELEGYYSNGESRIGLRKEVSFFRG